MIWVAEIGSAHKGSKAQAFEMIRQAKKAGATIAKFQLGWTPEIEQKWGNSPMPRRPDRKGVSVRYIDDWAEDLAKWCKDLEIEFMASIWSMDALETARSVNMKRYKIAHQMDDKDLITEMVSDGKDIFTSLDLNRMGILFPIFCSPDYPAYPPLDHIVNRFEETHYFGYSSHMHGYADALIAVARGAQYIEKHVTLNKADTTLRDNAFALNFDEFAEMVSIGNEMARLR